MKVANGQYAYLIKKLELCRWEPQEVNTLGGYVLGHNRSSENRKIHILSLACTCLLPEGKHSLLCYLLSIIEPEKANKTGPVKCHPLLQTRHSTEVLRTLWVGS